MGRHDFGHRGTTAEAKARLRDHPPRVYSWNVTTVLGTTLSGTTDRVLATVYDPASRIVDQRDYPVDEGDLAAEWAARRALTLRAQQ